MFKYESEAWAPGPIPESASWSYLREIVSKRLTFMFPALAPNSNSIPASQTPSGIATVRAKNRKALRLRREDIESWAGGDRLKNAGRPVTKFLGRKISDMDWDNLRGTLDADIEDNPTVSNDEYEFTVQVWLQDSIRDFVLPFAKLVILEDLKADIFDKDYREVLIGELRRVKVATDWATLDNVSADILIQTSSIKTVEGLKRVAHLRGKALELYEEETRLRRERETITFFELKKWNTHPEITDILDKAIECGASIHTFDTFTAAMEESYRSAGRNVPTKANLQTAYATFVQVLERMDTRMCSHVVLTTVYGSWYEVYKNQDDKEDPTYHWTVNLASDECKLAHNDNAYRKDERVLREIMDRVFFFVLSEVEERIQMWRSILDNARDEDSLEHVAPRCSLVPLPSLSTMAQMRTVMDPLSLDDRHILSSTIYLNLLRTPGGYGAVVWQDTSRGVVLKQFVQEEVYRKEVHFYRRLRGVPWVPTLLGTTSTEGRWGIFLTYEGWSMGDVEWCDSDVRTFVKECVRELHERGIHHHDLAPRNILRRPDRSYALVDFGMAVDEKDCKGGEDCPDCEVVLSF